MKRFNASARVSSGVLTAVFMFTLPAYATATRNDLPLENDAPQPQTVIEEWHWRDMNV
ncbi:MAG: hypothetical protein F6K11_33675 [Leptolyngbya sp. SIO3F4]|nr:hypothetical protein [Leptolyngbya sp. SIO3F4]